MLCTRGSAGCAGMRGATPSACPQSAFLLSCQQAGSHTSQGPYKPRRYKSSAIQFNGHASQGHTSQGHTSQRPYKPRPYKPSTIQAKAIQAKTIQAKGHLSQRSYKPRATDNDPNAAIVKISLAFLNWLGAKYACPVHTCSECLSGAESWPSAI
jgi:hypothetical protein